MLYIPTATRQQLEDAIIADADLYAQFDEARLLAGDYADDELRETIQNWIEQSPDF